MSNKKILNYLRKITFFENFTDDELQSITGYKDHIQKFDNGKYIIRQNDRDYSVYVLLKGAAIVTKNESPNITLNVMKTGAVFGEVSYLAKRPRSVNVLAKGETVVLRMDAKLLSTVKPDTHLKFMGKFIQILIKRIDIKDLTVIKLKKRLNATAKKEEKVTKILENVKNSKGDIPKQVDKALDSSKEIGDELGDMMDALDLAVEEKFGENAEEFKIW